MRTKLAIHMFKHGITQQVVADRIGVTRQYISLVMGGAEPINELMAEAIHDAVGGGPVKNFWRTTLSKLDNTRYWAVRGR